MTPGILRLTFNDLTSLNRAKSEINISKSETAPFFRFVRWGILRNYEFAGLGKGLGFWVKKRTNQRGAVPLSKGVYLDNLGV